MIYISIYSFSWLVLLLSSIFFYNTKNNIFNNFKIKYLLFFILAFHFESIFFGPFSRMEIGDGEHVYLGYLKYLTDSKSSLYLKELAGGVDRYSVGRIGGEFFSTYLFLFKFLNYWQTLLIIRLSFFLISFFGVYLLLRRTFKVNESISFILGIFYSTCFEFNISMNILYGLSYSGIPFLIYQLTQYKKSIKDISLFILFTSLFISTSYPYWAGIPTVIILITIYFVTNPRSKKFYIFGSLFFLFFWFINYLETTLGLILNLEESSRSLRECCASSVNSNMQMFIKHLFRPLNSFLYTSFSLTLIFPLLISIYIFVKYKVREKKLIYLWLLFLILNILPIFLDGKTYRSYFEYSSIIILIHIFAKSLSKSKNDNINKISISILMGVILSCFVVLKGYTLIKYINFGTLSNFDNSNLNIENNKWYNKNYRVISFPKMIDYNSLVSKGYATFQIQATLINKDIYNYWSKINLSNTDQHISIYGIKLKNEQLFCCTELNLDNEINFQLLKLTNTKYIISKLPLISNELKLIKEPKVKYQNNKKGKFSKYFDPITYLYPFYDNDFYVYELSDVYPKIFSPDQMRFHPENEFFDNLIEYNQSNGQFIIFLNENYRNKLENYFDSFQSPKIKIDNVTEIDNGYKIDLKDNISGGMIVLNHPFSKWWTTSTEDIEIIKGNYYQTVLLIKKDIENFSIIYYRPLIQDYIYGFLNN